MASFFPPLTFHDPVRLLLDQNLDEVIRRDALFGGRSFNKEIA